MPSKKPNGATLKIGLVFDDSLDRTDGVSQYVKTLGKWLSDQGHEVRYLVGETKLSSWHGGRVYSLSRNIGVSFNGNRLTIPLLAKRAQINKILKDEKFDILHVQVPYSPLMAKKVIEHAPTATAVTGTFHILPASSLASMGTKLLKYWYGRSLRRINPMLAVSKSAAEFCYYSLGRTSTVISNMVELKRFKQGQSLKLDPGRIVFLGRLVERKGCLELLSAFSFLVKSHPDARLLIAGDGPQRIKLEKFAARNGLESKVSFLGFIDEKDKPKFFANSAIACFPATGGESFGIVLIEAMAAGAGVVIGGNNPGYSTVLKAETLFDPGDPMGLSRLLAKLLDDRRLAGRLHRDQRAIVKHYDVNEVGPQIMAAYRKAVAKLNQKSHN